MRFVQSILIVTLLLSTPFLIWGQEKKLTEDQKIEKLIEGVRNLKDAKFIRNGSEYDAPAAADHMKRKWTNNKKDIKTARDFIKVAATKSSLSGEEYKIKFKDGKTVKSADHLNGELEKLEK